MSHCLRRSGLGHDLGIELKSIPPTSRSYRGSINQSRLARSFHVNVHPFNPCVFCRIANAEELSDWCIGIGSDAQCEARGLGCSGDEFLL
jgi:hypothetical protein